MRSLLTALIALLIFSYTGQACAKSTMPVAKNGVLDLRDWDFSAKNNMAVLDGQWKFAWRKFVSPTDHSKLENLPQITVPSDWHNARFGDEVSDGRGYGTYYLRVLVPANTPPLAIQSNGLSYAASFFINGEPIRTIGTPGKNPATEVPASIVDAFRLPPSASTSQTLDIVIQVSNHIHARGGMSTSINLGSAKSIMAHDARHRAFLLALIGGMIALLFYYLILYATRRSDRTPLYFAGFLLATALHMSTGSGVLAEILPFFSGQTLLRLEYLAVVGGALPVYLFVTALYPQIGRPCIRWAILIYSAIALVSLFTLNSYQYTSIVLAYEAGMLLTTLVAIVSLSFAVYRKLTDAHILLGGLVTAFLALIFGVIVYRAPGAPMGMMVYVAITGFVLSQAITLGRQMGRSNLKTKQLGLALTQANEQLEMRVAERTKQLNKALHEANAASKIKSEFLATMSHEIRTPMNGIIGMTEVVLGADLPPKQRENVEVIMQSANTLMVILNDILDISKIEAGKITLESRPFSPSNEIKKAMALWKEPLARKGLKLKSEIQGDLSAPVQGDEMRIGQILSNFLSNACKFTQTGHVKLIAKAKAHDDKIHYEFRIEDTGPGINRYKVGRIFETFTQEDQSTSRRFGGTGLGLSICADLAKLMGGTIKYDSGYEDGAAFIFKITLPKAVGVAQSEEKKPARRSVKSRRLNLLVAEDNAINQKVIKAVLAKMPFNLSFALDGLEAVQLAETEQFDVILMDIQMPNMGGIEATKTIRSTSGPNTNTPIIAVTANAMAGDREIYMHAGMNDFVAKPVNPIILVQAISRAAKVRKKSKAA
jgi:signal transduction histidine kinase/ActR/RegA family two-component response regulator